MQKMASGYESLELTDAGSWESFPPFAEKYVEQIGASVRKKIEAPDMHIWEIEYSGSVLNFVYDDFPNGTSIEPKSKKAQKAVKEIYEVALGQRDSNGL